MNTFLSSKGSPTVLPREVIRATEEEKAYQISMLEELHKSFESEVKNGIQEIQKSAIQNRNIFEQLMETIL